MVMMMMQCHLAGNGGCNGREGGKLYNAAAERRALGRGFSPRLSLIVIFTMVIIVITMVIVGIMMNDLLSSWKLWPYNPKWKKYMSSFKFEFYTLDFKFPFSQ